MKEFIYNSIFSLGTKPIPIPLSVWHGSDHSDINSDTIILGKKSPSSGKLWKILIKFYLLRKVEKVSYSKESSIPPVISDQIQMLIPKYLWVLKSCDV